MGVHFGRACSAQCLYSCRLWAVSHYAREQHGNTVAKHNGLPLRLRFQVKTRSSVFTPCKLCTLSSCCQDT